MTKATTQELVAAYRELGSVWKVAKRFGMCGQSVWERLSGLNLLRSTRWTVAEKQEAIRLTNQGYALPQIARELGRPYSGVARILSDAGVRVRLRRERKAPRAVIATPWNAMNWMLQLQASRLTVSHFSRTNGLDMGLIYLTPVPIWV